MVNLENILILSNISSYNCFCYILRIIKDLSVKETNGRYPDFLSAKWTLLHWNGWPKLLQPRIEFNVRCTICGKLNNFLGTGCSACILFKSNWARLLMIPDFGEEIEILLKYDVERGRDRDFSQIWCWVDSNGQKQIDRSFFSGWKLEDVLLDRRWYWFCKIASNFPLRSLFMFFLPARLHTVGVRIPSSSMIFLRFLIVYNLFIPTCFSLSEHLPLLVASRQHDQRTGKCSFRTCIIIIIIVVKYSLDVIGGGWVVNPPPRITHSLSARPHQAPTLPVLLDHLSLGRKTNIKLQPILSHRYMLYRDSTI